MVDPIGENDATPTATTARCRQLPAAGIVALVLRKLPPSPDMLRRSISLY